MAESIVPVIRVPDVRATAEWYQGIGFTLCGTNADCGEMNWRCMAPSSHAANG